MTTKQQARHMYMHESRTQRQIAKELGVDERTIYTWIYGNSWDKLRIASYAAPAMISQNLCSQLVEMQNAIATREPGQRFPTMQESTIQARLISGMEKLKRYPSLSQNIQVLETFKRYVSPLATKEFNTRLNMFTELYAEVEAKNGFRPYEIEYGIDCTPLPDYESDKDPAHQSSSNGQQQPEEDGTSDPHSAESPATHPGHHEADPQQPAATGDKNCKSEEHTETSVADPDNYSSTLSSPEETNTLEQEWERLVLLVQASTALRPEINAQK